MTKPLSTAFNIDDLREAARRRLPRGLFEFVDRGTEDDLAVRNNRTAFERIALRPRVLVDVSKRSQSINLFGAPHGRRLGYRAGAVPSWGSSRPLRS